MNKKIFKILKENLCPEQIACVKKYRRFISVMLQKLIYPYGRFVKTPINLLKNKKKSQRLLEIGPGALRLPNFETINIVCSHNVDYICDASKSLPFTSNTFDLIYASHMLEHVSWYQVPRVLKEWVRILKPGGTIEIWVPNGLLIAETFVKAELGIENKIDEDGWYKFNEQHDPCIWANGRIFSYGDGTGLKNDPNWHLTVFSPRYLRSLLTDAGLINIHEMERSEVRGADHGWINLGMRGLKQ